MIKDDVLNLLNILSAYKDKEVDFHFTYMIKRNRDFLNTYLKEDKEFTESFNKMIELEHKRQNILRNPVKIKNDKDEEVIDTDKQKLDLENLQKEYADNIKKYEEESKKEIDLKLYYVKAEFAPKMIEWHGEFLTELGVIKTDNYDLQ